MSYQTVYLICIIGGIALLAISLMFGAVGDALDFGAADMFSLDIGDADIDILPISLKSLCLAATVFGSVSMLLQNQPVIIRHAVAGVLAYVGAFLIQNFTGFLKNHESEADSIESICGRDYMVNVAIPQGGYGSVASTSADRSVLTLTARSADGSALAQGTPVEVINVTDNVAIVSRKQKEEK